MGNKESEQAKEFHIEINHPRFLKSTILTHNALKQLQTSQAIDQKEYDRWKQALKKYSAVPENLLLPIEHNFSRSGLCGNTGTLIVIRFPHSSPTTTTPTCSAKKSTTERASRPTSHKHSCGACSSAFPRLSGRRRQRGRDWATSGPRTSSSTKREASKWPTPSRGHFKTPTSRNPSTKHSPTSPPKTSTNSNAEKPSTPPPKTPKPSLLG